MRSGKMDRASKRVTLPELASPMAAANHAAGACSTRVMTNPAKAPAPAQAQGEPWVRDEAAWKGRRAMEGIATGSGEGGRQRGGRITTKVPSHSVPVVGVVAALRTRRASVGTALALTRACASQPLSALAGTFFSVMVARSPETDPPDSGQGQHEHRTRNQGTFAGVQGVPAPS